jgi:DNA modification methylase
MITKSEIDRLKNDDLTSLYRHLMNGGDDAKTLFILKSLGRLPENFDGDCVRPYLKHPRAEIRLWTVKNLGKLKNTAYLESIFEIAIHDEDSMTRREAVSSIGRMRSRQAIPFLAQLLEDHDPKVVLQAMRGLMVFKDNVNAREALVQLKRHPNEMIQTIFERELQENESNKTSSHPDSPKFLKNVAICGDVQDVLPLIPDESIHLTFTSPPYYNARDYSIYESYEAYLDFLTNVFAEVHRVTKEGRFFILNTSPIIVPRISRAYSSKRYPIPFDIHGRLAEIGWEFIDDIVWAKPEASVKNRNAGFLQHRKPLGYKPNPVTEYLMVYRKKTTKLLDWNMRQYDQQTLEASKVTNEYETSNLWHIDPRSDKVHSAIFPLELCHRVIQYYSYIGDLVFDPFGGSGTFGRAAKQLDRFFLLTEANPEYFDRMRENLTIQPLFDTRPNCYYTFAQFTEMLKET